MRRRVRWPGNDPRHDGRAGHAQTRKSTHAKLWVDDREIIHAHFACADGVSEARRAEPGKFPDLTMKSYWPSRFDTLVILNSQTYFAEGCRAAAAAKSGRLPVGLQVDNC